MNLFKGIVLRCCIYTFTINIAKGKVFTNTLLFDYYSFQIHCILPPPRSPFITHPIILRLPCMLRHQFRREAQAR